MRNPSISTSIARFFHQDGRQNSGYQETWRRDIGLPRDACTINRGL